MFYVSTRGLAEPADASVAILNGLAGDGGLYVPDGDLPRPDLAELVKSGSYAELAKCVLRPFFGGGVPDGDDCLNKSIDRAYADPANFTDAQPASVEKPGAAWLLDLTRGKTLAFKDMALSLLPGLMDCARAATGSTTVDVILTATSGDTGKAALAAFEDVPGTIVIVFYPKDGVSKMQELMMTTQGGGNTRVVGVSGNFDRAQTAVKRIFASAETNAALKARGMRFSSANSINIGRLFPQVVYYFYAYLEMAKQGGIRLGEPINISVPTGNFGNILAAWYAARMGLPVGRLICASNANRVLHDFFKTARYDLRREMVKTTSPSMDIIISSNLERLIFEISGRDAAFVRGFYEQLGRNGFADLPEHLSRRLEMFVPYFATDDDAARVIKSVHDATGRLIDPHTAAAWDSAEKYTAATGDTRPMLVVSTASVFKFPETVLEAVWGESGGAADLARKSGLPLPVQLAGIETKPILHTSVCDPDDAEHAVLEFLLKGAAR